MILEEASYKEFMQRYKRDSSFAIISAYSGDVNISTNIANNKTLRRIIKDEGYEQLRVIGNYIEDNTPYESMIVFCPDNVEENTFLKFLLYFSRKYRQNGIIYVDKENNIWIYATRTNSTFGASGSRIRLDKFQVFDIKNLIELFTKRTYEVDAVKIVND